MRTKREREGKPYNKRAQLWERSIMYLTFCVCFVYLLECHALQMEAVLFPSCGHWILSALNFRETS